MQDTIDCLVIISPWLIVFRNVFHNMNCFNFFLFSNDLKGMVFELLGLWIRKIKLWLFISYKPLWDQKAELIFYWISPPYSEANFSNTLTENWKHPTITNLTICLYEIIIYFEFYITFNEKILLKIDLTSLIWRGQIMYL